MSVTSPQGFRAAGVAAGIKQSGAPDLAVVVNDGPRMHVAGVFTRNGVQAAPVKWSRHAVSDGQLQAVVLNSGGANACTGAPGFQDAAATAAHAATALQVPADNVAVCSTGLIGVRLPMEALRAGVTQAAGQLTTDGGTDAARAIMTTDTRPKEAVADRGTWRVGGMAKGAGMLAPGLATMLVVLTTDADVDQAVLDVALREATRVTFDRTDSDGCMSTNDTVLALASGAAGVTPSAAELTEALVEVSAALARQLIGDAEGAAHDIAVEVTGAATEDDAVAVAREIARSNLFKCAVFGNDPNWGRVLSAIGVTDAAFDPDRIDVSFNGVMVCRAGAIGEDRALVDLGEREVHVLVDLHEGAERATVWTNDLTHDYVRENAEYSS
ncbi:bifunctional glutamate N-acetyltransferase/amino-acid acetyltransferase ArgJ [uncultured Tessaracoccus sp.]|uniref:bifunctional glutamate N-acetyltransferase/amino-acid acetyltransferase ArgJ n=1 Tax=uncultured Tessaracoccus sp. TaxID=905023 RepID=UPI0025F7FA02|nr:bifunctional glutamate N-acetyltransferase/amino-acid acetyltransferase ArgJ [uncultured Tessaracoccus sp.]